VDKYINACEVGAHSSVRQRALVSLFLSTFVDKAELSTTSNKFGTMLFIILLAAEDPIKPLHSEAARGGIAALLYIYRLFLLYFIHFSNQENLLYGERVELDPIQGSEGNLTCETFMTYVSENVNTPYNALSMAQKLCKVSLIAFVYFMYIKTHTLVF
jgi:hypothetical protein